MVRIYDSSSDVPVRTLNAERDIVWNLAFSRDGSRFATASGNEVVAQWNPHTGERHASFSGHSGGATDVAFLADGHTLVDTDRSGGLHWRDLLTHRKLSSPMQAHARSSWRLAVHPDGATIATAGDDGLAKVWDALSIDRACELGRPTLDARHLRQYLGADQQAVDCSRLSRTDQPQQ